MTKEYIAQISILINAESAAVWDALTNPELIKQYLFGTETISDWKVGSRITYRGVWEGKTYEDGGVILKFEPEKILSATYWSSMSGTEDIPENYCTITYSLEKESGGTLLTIQQDKCKTEEARDHSEKNWGMVLQSLKSILEK
ncbi:MAG: activator of Hsp90 ATPase 1 family protein [Stygiobacter sp.]|nr:MAG: activator of Hsp90 ATPase 1 family protein [Stygiobacter sp.]